MNLYVYYQLPSPTPALLQALRDAQDEVAAVCGVRTRLMRRRDDATTWMEVYEEIGDANAFGRGLEGVMARRGLLQATAPRHEEWFVDA